MKPKPNGCNSCSTVKPIKRRPDCCSSCAVEWDKHAGIAVTCDRLHRALDALNVIRVWANTGIIGALPESVVEIIDKATGKHKAK